MKLYHGTNVEFEQIDLLKSKPNKDFGRGFYLSANYVQAKDMAEAKVEQLEWGSPVVLEYETDEAEWSVAGCSSVFAIISSDDWLAGGKDTHLSRISKGVR